ncbi:MAG TPA: DUF3313 family protein [Gammaproteobacteria bacterium]|nr:DUF3313 family protein [Gammaproteobacteria bacterium]
MAKSSLLKTWRTLAIAVLLLAMARGEADELTVVYRKPDVSLAEYRQFLLRPLNLDDARLIPPPWVENANAHEWKLTDDSRAFLRTAYADAVRAGIESEGRYTVVDQPTAGALQLEVYVVSLTPWASRAERDVETLGTGALTFEAHVRDSRTAELLGVVKGTQHVGKEYQENTIFNKQSDIEEHFTAWGRDISRWLANAQKP